MRKRGVILWMHVWKSVPVGAPISINFFSLPYWSFCSAAAAHGFQMISDLEKSGMVSGNGLDPAGLYRTLKRMETAGLVTSYWDTESASKPRRVYSITDEGRHCLSAWEKTLLEYRSNIDAILRGILSAEEL